MSCEKCWGDAYLAYFLDPSKTQAEWYRELLESRKDNPCKLTLDCRRCPHCGTDLMGEPIPENVQESFGGATHFQRQIGITLADEDHVSLVRCPDCGVEDKR